MAYSTDRIQHFPALRAQNEAFVKIQQRQAACPCDWSKVVDGNTIRCARCRRIVGFVRAPKS